jgi:hypothetical protein
VRRGKADKSCSGVVNGALQPIRLDSDGSCGQDDHPPGASTPSGCAPPRCIFACRLLTPAWCADHTDGMYYRPAFGLSRVRRPTVAFASIARLGEHPQSQRRPCRSRSPKTRVLLEEYLLCIAVHDDGALLPIESCSVLPGLFGEPICPGQVILRGLLIVRGLVKGLSRSYLVCKRL